MLSIREMQVDDLPRFLNYWYGASESFLNGMGVDIKRLPLLKDFESVVIEQLNLPIEKKTRYYLVWEDDGKAFAHCNTNPTTFGSDALMHLHMWDAGKRKQGIGTIMVKRSIELFFEKLELKKLVCEPYGFNKAPNKTLEKIGFTLIHEYFGFPGPMAFEQPVKRWQLTLEDYNRKQQNKEW